MSEKAVKDASDLPDGKADKIKPEDKKTIEEKINALKKVKDSADIEMIKKASQELSNEIQKIGEALYKKEAVPEGGEPRPDNTGREAPKEVPKSEDKKEENKK